MLTRLKLGNFKSWRDKRLIEVEIEYDENDCATLPFYMQDEDDRKFAAVALKVDPHPPIIDATDTDWELHNAVVIQAGLTVQELCPTYIQKLIAEKGKSHRKIIISPTIRNTLI
jgi:hypothetical protein